MLCFEPLCVAEATTGPEPVIQEQIREGTGPGPVVQQQIHEGTEQSVVPSVQVQNELDYVVAAALRLSLPKMPLYFNP